MSWASFIEVASGISCTQNRVGELYSLIRFLRIYPYAFYFCAQGCAKSSKGPPCTCRSLDYPFSRNHRHCDHCQCALPHSCPPYSSLAQVSVCCQRHRL